MENECAQMENECAQMENECAQMENECARRKDGSVIIGTTLSKWKEYIAKYFYLSEEELIHLIDYSGSIFMEHSFRLVADHINDQREHENKYGKEASYATSLFMVLSVQVKPMKSSTLSVFGEITSVSGDYPDKKDYIYKIESPDVQRFSGSDDDGYLTLNGPSDSCRPDEAFFLFQSRKLSITLYTQPGECLLFDDDIMLDYSKDGFENVKKMDVKTTTDEISLTLNYISIPMALCGCLEIRMGKKDSSEFVNVSGKVVAKYKNTFGNYESEEIVLFDCERVLLAMETNLLSSSRCWVAAPAYSLLCLRIDLFDSANIPILTEDVELETDNSLGSSKRFISGEYLISVSSSWSNTSISPEQDDCDYQINRGFDQWAPVLDLAVEVFSVLVCYDERTPLQIHGRLQFNTACASDDFIESGFDIFKIEEKDLFPISGRGDIIPFSNAAGSRAIRDYLPVSMICDLKDTKGGLNIKGYLTLRESRFLDRQLCSVFRGDHGFAAVHFSIFRSAMQAEMQVFVYQRQGSQCAVSGSICAEYNGFDYSSQYKKNSYSIVFFKGSVDFESKDAVELLPSAKFLIPLSRSSFLVPSYSSARFDLNLTIGTEKLTSKMNVKPGAPTRSINGEECKVEFDLKWKTYAEY